MAKGSLDAYRSKRDPARTPEPVPTSPGEGSRGHRGNRFVIQEHHATALHWDFRLERDGVLVSWALPKGLPLDPRTNHLAVHTEDHPLEYLTFSGTIPAGEYGGGTVAIWDHGTYECEKWRDDEVIVVLDGTRAMGRYALFATKGKQWMIHRMDPAPAGYQPLPETLAPMLATPGHAAHERRGLGLRVQMGRDPGDPRRRRWAGPGAQSRNGRDITGSYPELRALGEAVGADQLLLDSELVVVDEGGRPSFGRLQHRMQLEGPSVARAAAQDPVSIVLFDLLHHNGEPLYDLPYDDRRARLDGLGLAGPRWAVTPAFVDEEPARGPGPGHRHRDGRPRGQAAQQPLPAGHAQPRLDEGQGRAHAGGRHRRLDPRPGQPLGRPSVPFSSAFPTSSMPAGSGSSGRSAPVSTIRPWMTCSHASNGLAVTRARSPSGCPPERGRWPMGPSRLLVGEVRYTEWTAEGRLRHPMWRGLRPDKSAEEVVREP